MNKFIKSLLFLILLFLSNLYILRPGFWFYQDAGFWPKTNYEAMTLLLRQFHIFTNLGYYMGTDQGLLSFSSILVTGFISFMLFIFQQNNSQIVFTFAGYILAFASFYLFSGIFFKDKKLRYVLSLVYVFSPWSYMTQGYIFYSALAPLFIYSFYKYFFESGKFRAKYLLLNIFAAYIWVAYIRFIQGYAFIIIPYLFYLAFNNRDKLNFKKIVIYFFSCLLVFAPTVFVFVSQLLEKSNTAFNYGSIFGNFVVKDKMYNAFNLFQSVGAKLYEGWWWPVLGLILFAYIVYLILTFSRSKHSYFYLLNLALILIGITMYGLGNIFGNVIYLKVIHFLPFIVNEPYWAMSILGVPFIMLVGLLTKDRMKYLYIFAFFFVVFSTLPLLNLSDFQLQKFKLNSAPAPYKNYFVTPYIGIPEASYYYLGDCWRAEFMDKVNVPTFCINYDQHYPTIIFNNPRVVSGETLDISQFLYATTQVNDLRITHNLKDIFVPNDMVITKGPGPLTGEKEIQMAKNANKVFGKNKLLLADSNPNFTYYTFSDKDKYDFLIYLPKTVIRTGSLNILTDNSLDINAKPVILPNNALGISDVISNAKIEYKISPLEPYKYFLHITNINNIHSFLIQFNQKYSSNWKLKLVTKAYFDKEPCIADWKTFPITDNSYCQYKNSLLDLGNFELLSKKNVADSSHIQGNFISNTWILYPKDTGGSKDLYLVIIYTKQVYYIYTILVAGITLTILFMIYIVQEIQIKITKRKLVK